jgi:hypothetical protein
MENLRNRRDIDIVMNANRLKKLAAQPTFKSFTIIHENMVAVERYRANIVLNRPIYVGFTCLDLSKILMYQWHYEKMKIMFPLPNHQYQLIYTDTDSLVYSIKTNDMYNIFAAYPELFDFSKYDINHICCQNNVYLNKNKKRIGIMKDELDGMIMTEFIGLRSKLYSFEIAEKDTAKAEEANIMTRKCKGVKTNVIKFNLKHQHYKTCLFQGEKKMVQINSIRSQKHQLQTIQQYKNAMTCFDDKRYILNDAITIRPHGHYKNKK